MLAKHSARLLHHFPHGIHSTLKAELRSPAESSKEKPELVRKSSDDPLFTTSKSFDKPVDHTH
jgi:hypothetical protein